MGKEFGKMFVYDWVTKVKTAAVMMVCVFFTYLSAVTRIVELMHWRRSRDILLTFQLFLGFMNAPRKILDLNNGAASTDEDVARDISNKLYEEKDTLLRKYSYRLYLFPIGCLLIVCNFQPNGGLHLSENYFFLAD